MQPGPLEGALHQGALLGIQRHGLFDAAMLAGCRHHQTVFEVAVGRCGDVHRVHFGVVDQGLGVGIETGNAVACRIITHSFFTAPHHGHQRRTWRFVEGGSTLEFSDAATANHAPTYGIHQLSSSVFIKGAVSTSPLVHASLNQHDNCITLS